MDLVSSLLTSVHDAAAIEAIALASKSGLNLTQVYDIIAGAAGSSGSFKALIPPLLKNAQPQSRPAVDLSQALDVARSVPFPLPLASAVEQIEIASGVSSSTDKAAALSRFYSPGDTASARLPKSASSSSFLTPMSSPYEINKIGVIGLGAMGQGMAASLLRAGYDVQGFDVYQPSMDKFLTNPGKATLGKSACETVSGADIALLMVQNAAQADDILFGEKAAAAHNLADGAVVILSSTVPPSFTRTLDAKLKSLGRGISLIDAPVSGGVVRAANGTLTIICSGDETAISKAQKVLLSMSGDASNLHIIQGGVGAASSVKVVNQLLAGVHIAAAAEALAFAARLGLNTREVFDRLCESEAWSWMLENRGPQMLNADWTPHSALAIFVKDLGIVLGEAKRLGLHAPVASAAHTLYLSGAAKGWSRDSDAGVVRLWESDGAHVAKMAGTSNDKPVPASQILDSLPPPSNHDHLSDIQNAISEKEIPTLVVLDDDPTGTQTCHGINVLTVWDVPTLEQELRSNNAGFFILTNSRALNPSDAKQLIKGICLNLKAAAKSSGKSFEIVLRGDSTLRGHLPEEPEAAEEALGSFDGWVVTPFFAQGGRITVDDVHYIKEGDTMTPVHLTPFAQDATFGYRNSDLRQYVLEKCGSRFNNDSFVSITIDDIRLGGPAAVKDKLMSRQAGSSTVIIVNATEESDMHIFVAGLLQAEKAGRRYLYRTGAAFVSSRLGIRGIPPLTLQDLDRHGANLAPMHGGLIIAGSYVPKTTEQLAVLRKERGDKLHVIELQVQDLLSSHSTEIIKSAALDASTNIASGHDVLVMTSRELIKADDALESLEIGSKVASTLVQLLEQIDVRPRYLIAKGGITSSDAATKGLRMRRAQILGQAAPGVPLWRCDEETSRHRGMAYVVFPGNVGSKDTLNEVVTAWARQDKAKIPNSK